MASYLSMPGMISSKAAAKRPAILGKTRVNRPNEEDFDGKQGLGDQGGADWNKPLDGGDRSVASTKHINTKQTMGTPAKAGGAPSKGGSAGAQKQPIKRNQIDDGAQRPKYPNGTGYATGDSDKAAKTGYAKTHASPPKWKDHGKVNAKGPKAPSKLGKKSNPSNSNQYGDPNSRRYG